MKLAQVQIAHFRGIPESLTLDLPVGSSAALLLVGDNGTGKSSIADAIEVGLQARFRLSSRDLGSRVRSHAVDAPPFVRVTFEDGSTTSRDFEVREDGRVVLRGRDPVDGYSIGPVVLRRTDIVGFWDVPERERQVVFLNFVGTLRAPDPHEAVKRFEDSVAALKDERVVMREELATAAGVPAEGIPMDVEGLERYTRDFLGSKHGTRSGQRRLYFPPEIWRPLDAYRSVVTRTRRANQRLAAERARAGEMPRRTRATAAELLERAGAQMTEGYRRIMGDGWIRHVRVTVGGATDASLSVDLHLANGRVVSPQALSEANRDLIALLLFVSLAVSAYDRGQAPFLVLDDVFHSVDAPVRVRAMETLLQWLSGWQLVLTTYDRLWLEQARRALLAQRFEAVPIEIARWSFDQGPVIRAAASGPRARLERQLEHGQPRDITAVAGVIAEQICDVLSWTLRTQVTRNEGDRYTIGDLWPGVLRNLRGTDAVREAEGLDGLGYFRNLTGAHYNEPAEQLSMHEACDYGARVLALLDRVYCRHCSTWVKRRAEEWRCSCGQTSVAPK